MSWPTPPPPPRRHSSAPLYVLSLVLAAVTGLAVSQLWQRRLHTTVTPRPITARGDLASDEKATIALFEQASPSVVYITNLAVRRDWLGLDVTEVPQGTGSGFIWDDRGYVVTNFHVIQEAQAAEVTLADQSNWPARLVGYEPDKDVAVLKIDAPRPRMRPLAVG